jgi:nucleotide-binding universal stress UspA family protein
MFKNVIVGVDGRSGGRDAAALACRLLEPRGKLTLVHVHLETTAVIVHEFNSSAQEEAQQLLESEREAAGGEAELASIGGTSVALGLHRYAEEHAADLLVVGTCHRGAVGRVVTGDDTRASLQCSPCAVAISPRGYAESPSPVEVIGVGYDASAESQAALAKARELAGGGDLEIHALIVVTAVRFDGFRLAPLNSVMGTDPRLNDLRRQLNELDYVTARPAYGLPVEELGAFGEEVDLLLLGSPSEGPKGRMVANRVSKHLARAALCPLLVVPLAPVQRGFAEEGKARGGAAPRLESTP